MKHSSGYAGVRVVSFLLGKDQVHQRQREQPLGCSFDRKRRRLRQLIIIIPLTILCSESFSRASPDPVINPTPAMRVVVWDWVQVNLMSLAPVHSAMSSCPSGRVKVTATICLLDLSALVVRAHAGT